MTTNNNNNSNTIDDLIDSGEAGAATYSDEANGDGSVIETMDSAPPVPSNSPTGPVLSGGNNSVDYLPGLAPVAVDAKLAVSDAESTTLTGATVAISTGFFAGDTLNFANLNGIIGTYNASTGILTLTGTASVANYQTALESITYSSTNINPTAAGTNVNRTVSWTVTDGTQTSNTITSAVIVGLLDGVEGAFAVYDIRNNAIISVNNLGQLGLAWEVAGFGDFSGIADETDMMMRNSNTGVFQVYDISHNAITSTSPLGSVGLEWTVAGFGDFSGNANETDMLLRNSDTSAFEVLDISNNAVTSAVAMGAVGLEWTVAGFGDFSGNANETDMLLRNSGTGAFEVYDISHNTITSASLMGAVGLEWTIAGFGDFSGNANETDMILRNSNTGAFELYDISHNQITGAVSMGQVGLEWAVVGFGNFSGNANETDMLLRNSNNDNLEIFDISHNALTSVVPIGAIGLEWQVSGFGNFSSSDVESDMVMRDTRLETATVVPPLGPLGSLAAATATFVVNGDLDPDFTGPLTLTDGTFGTVLAYTGNGSYTANLETWPNGTVTASLAVIDSFGNSFATSTMVAIATDLGETVGLSGPPGTLGSSAAAAAKFVVTGNLDANYSGSLTLTDGGSSTALAYTGDGTYTANLETWPNGMVSASLAVTDPAGNSFSATATAALATDFSETVGLSGPPGTLGSSAAAAAKFVVTGNLDVNYSGSLTLTDGASSTALPYVGDGTYTANLETWPNGTVSASLAVTDPAGNSFSATATASLVTDFSETVGLSGPPGTLGSSAAAATKFVVTGNLDADYSGSLTLTDGASSTAFAYTGDGTYTANLDTWPNGVVNASLAVTDPAGNSFGASATAALQPDFSETVALSGPAGTLGSSAAAAAKFVVTGNLDANYAGSLTLTDGASSTALPYVGDGTYVANLETWPDGAVSVTLTVSDPVGNSFTASTTAAIDPDFGEAVTLTPASTLIGSSAAAAVKFVVTGNLDAADTIGSLTLTDGAMASAESFTGNGTYTFNLSANSWADGSVTSTLTVTDAAGNSFAAAGAPVTLDKETGETATLTVTNPNETVGHATVSFTIGGLEAIDNNLAGSTATVTFAEGGGNTITDTIAAPSLGHTYTQTLAFATFSTAGSVTASLTFTDAASNTLTATASPGVTLIPPAPQFGPTDGDGPPGNAMEGSVLDLETGTITLVVENLTSLTSQTLFVSETASNATISWLSTISYNQAGVGDSYSLQAYEQGGATVNQAGNGLAPAGAAGSPINLALTNLALTDPGGGEPVAVTIAGVPAGWSLNAGTNLGNGTWAVETSDPSSLAVTTPATFAGAVVLTVSESWTNPDGGTGSARIADNVEAYAPGNAIFALSGDDTLTGSGANDVFVFARPIGSDTIDNFNPASDRIDLVGFANVASFADIQASLADDANGNAVITLGNGETITITGVGSAALSAANFLLNQEPVTTNAGTMTIADGAMLPLGGTVDNSATIALASAGGGATLQVQASGVTLQGGGQVVLSDDGRNLVTAADPSAVLTNVDNTISGAGELGAGQLTLDNRGVIDATGANALVIDTGGNVVANSGTLEATGSGGLMVAGAVANSGTLAADGGNLTVEGAVSGSGGAGAEISGGATLEFGAASSANVGFAAGAAGMLKLDQASGFSGTVAGLGAGDAIDLADIAFGGGDTLAYAANAAGTGGVLSVSDGTHAANLALLGQYAASEFATAPDPGGGTVVTYGQAPPSGTTDQALLAHPPH